MPNVLKSLLRIFVLLVVILLILIFIGWLTMFQMPGNSYRGPLPPLSEDASALTYLLEEDVKKLAIDFSQRNVYHYDELCKTADFLEESLLNEGYQVQRYGDEVDGKTCYNLEAEILGSEKADEILVVGAHYDAVEGCPAANDNGSGVAALLALARAFTGQEVSKTLRFVFFVNEEPPFFQTNRMGSLHYAKVCRKRGDNVVGMISLETIGYYSDKPGSQQYPFPLNFFYPKTGDFIAFVGNNASRDFVHKIIGSFREKVQFPSEGGAFPSAIPGVGWSDHWAFWQVGYPAMMVTDTAIYRYPHYHRPTDTPDKLIYDRMARVVMGLEKVIAEFVNE